MRIAFVTNVVYPFITGGAEKRIHEIGTRLADRGHEVTGYGRYFWDSPQDATHEVMTLRAVASESDLYAGERRSITGALDYAARTLLPLRRRISNNEHDVVVASVFPYFSVLSIKLASIRTDTPLVTTCHDGWGDYWNKYLSELALSDKFTEHLTARSQRTIYTLIQNNLLGLTEKNE